MINELFPIIIIFELNRLAAIARMSSKWNEINKITKKGYL